MARTPAFDGIIRAIRLARAFDVAGISTKEGLERAAAARQPTRRDVLKGMGAAGLGLLATPSIARAVPRANASVGIVGAGLAGLSAADTLAAAGIAATLYEGRDRIGG